MARWAKCLLPNREDLHLGSRGIYNLYTSPRTGGSETRGSLSSRFGERDGFKAKAGEMAEWVKALPETDPQNPYTSGWRTLTPKRFPLPPLTTHHANVHII